jgi:hypothetical protein
MPGKSLTEGVRNFLPKFADPCKMTACIPFNNLGTATLLLL